MVWQLRAALAAATLAVALVTFQGIGAVFALVWVAGLCAVLYAEWTDEYHAGGP